MYERMRFLLHSDLSYFPNLAIILMSAHMKGARVRVRSYTSRRDLKKVDDVYLMTSTVLFGLHRKKFLPKNFKLKLCYQVVKALRVEARAI